MTTAPRKEAIRAELLKQTRPRGGRRTLTCHQALTIARSFGVTAAAVGRLCDAEKVKLVRCKLGCF